MNLQRVPMITLLVLAALTSLSLRAALAGPGLTAIDTAQLHTMIVDNAYRLEGGREKQYTIIDARTREEYDEAHIFSAISIPESDLERSTDRLPKDKGMLLVIYGNDAERWAARAAAAGYTNLAVYAEGFLVWKEKKMPVAPLRPDIR